MNGDALLVRTSYLATLSVEGAMRDCGESATTAFTPALAARVRIAAIAFYARNDVNPSVYAFDSLATPGTCGLLDLDAAAFPMPAVALAAARLGCSTTLRSRGWLRGVGASVAGSSS